MSMMKAEFLTDKEKHDSFASKNAIEIYENLPLALIKKLSGFDNAEDAANYLASGDDNHNNIPVPAIHYPFLWRYAVVEHLKNDWVKDPCFELIDVAKDIVGDHYLVRLLPEFIREQQDKWDKESEISRKNQLIRRSSDFHNTELGDVIGLNGLDYTRVPGSWVVQAMQPDTDKVLALTFVPHSYEFKNSYEDS